MKQKYSDEEIKEDIKSFFQNPDHWVHSYGYADDCNPDSPYHRKQLEVLFEDKYFHWVTHRIVDDLVKENFLKEEIRKTETKTPERVSFVYRRNIRYQKRAITKRLRLIEEYSKPNVSRALGKWGEHLSEFMFTRLGFEILARHSNKFSGKKWTKTNHNLDFIVEKDGIFCGVEVKNTLPYMERDEFKIKLEILQLLRTHPYVDSEKCTR